MFFFLFLLAGPQRSALPQLLGRISPTALVIVLKDLRWANRDTVELVEYLADNVSGLPVLPVLTLRDTPASTASAARRPQKLARNHLSPPRAIDRRPPSDPGAPAGPLGIQDCVGGLSCCSRVSRS